MPRPVPAPAFSVRFLEPRPLFPTRGLQLGALQPCTGGSHDVRNNAGRARLAWDVKRRADGEEATMKTSFRCAAAILALAGATAVSAQTTIIERNGPAVIEREGPTTIERERPAIIEREGPV